MTGPPPEVTAAVRRAEQLSLRYDQLVRRAAAAAGGAVHGDRGDHIDHAVKGADRVAEKIRSMTDQGIATTQALLSIGDLNRYTVVFPESDYTSGVQRFQAHLARDGVLLDQGKNTWQDPIYKGYNARFLDTGQPHAALDPAEAADSLPRHLFEVQAHTPASLTAKEDTHDLYKLMRAGTLREEGFDAAAELQARRNDVVAIPPGADTIGTPVPPRPRPDPPPAAAFAEVESALRQLRESRAPHAAAPQQLPTQRTPPRPPAHERQRLTPESSPASVPDPDYDRDEATRPDLDHGLG